LAGVGWQGGHAKKDKRVLAAAIAVIAVTIVVGVFKVRRLGGPRVDHLLPGRARWWCDREEDDDEALM
jgi:hypothetical protein